MRRRFFTLCAIVLATSLSAPATSGAQGKPRPGASKKSAKPSMGKGMDQNQAMDMVGNQLKAAGIEDPSALMNMGSTESDMEMLRKKTQGMTDEQREAYVDSWASKKLGVDPSKLGGLDQAAPPKAAIGSLDDIGLSSKKANLVYRSEKERRVELLKELRRHAALDAKIKRVDEIARARKDKVLAERARQLDLNEQRRHARQKIRIRAAKIAAPSAPAAPKNEEK